MEQQVQYCEIFQLTGLIDVSVQIQLTTIASITPITLAAVDKDVIVGSINCRYIVTFIIIQTTFMHDVSSTSAKRCV